VASVLLGELVMGGYLWRSWLIFVALLGLSGCFSSEDAPAPRAASSAEVTSEARSESALLASGVAVALSDSEFTHFTAEEQYRVVNKLLATLYKGVAVREFFDLSPGMTKAVASGEMTLTRIADDLRSELPADDYLATLAVLDRRYFFDSGRKRNTRAYALALLWEMPLSRQYYARWMAYTLANTILFSPALELESVSFTDVEAVFNRLSFAIESHQPIREMVYDHMISQENWRRFRSPEDNTREMMEIFLGLHDDSAVPKAAQACRNWALADDSGDYQLRIGQDYNLEPIADLLGRDDIISCHEFYRTVADHAALLPQIVRVVARTLLGEQDSAVEEMVAAIVALEPTTFSDIFTPLLFSRHFLLHAQRTQIFEESFFGTGQRLYYYAQRDLFHNLTKDRPTSGPPELAQMGQATMGYKLGRHFGVPTDPLSIAYYHASVREQLLLDTLDSKENIWDAGWDKARLTDLGSDQLNQRMSDIDFIHYLTLATLLRRASAEEIEALLPLINHSDLQLANSSLLQRRNRQAMVIFDYHSRLAELYTQPHLAATQP
jgi:hypothetical protein